MSIEHASVSVAEERRATPLGGTEFLSRAQRSQRCRELAESGYLVARVVPPYDRDGAEGLRRGTLREALEGAVEISLALRGALPPAVALGSAVEASARDQVCAAVRAGGYGLREIIVRVNALVTPWGQADVAAMSART